MVSKKHFSPARYAPSLLGGGKIMSGWRGLLDFSFRPIRADHEAWQTRRGWRDSVKREIEFARREKCDSEWNQSCEASLSIVSIKTWRHLPPGDLEPLMRFWSLECIRLQEFVCSSSHALKCEFQERCGQGNCRLDWEKSRVEQLSRRC